MSQANFTAADVQYMQEALRLAHAAAETGDIPVGALLVDDNTGEVIAAGQNTREALGTALGHAEINVIDAACRAQGGWRLENCTLYVTLEPCPMCAGAILQARVGRVVYGAADPVAGAMGSVWAIHRHPVESRHTTVKCGCMEEECKEMLQAFFRTRRESATEA